MDNDKFAAANYDCYSTSHLAPGAQEWHSLPITSGVPAFFASASGSRIRNSAGRELIDLYCGSGTVILGHAHLPQLEAVKHALDGGVTMSLRHPIERELASLIAETVSMADRVAFFKTGSEAIHAAIRVAFTATGRSNILTTGYHGWLHPLWPLGRVNYQGLMELDWASSNLIMDMEPYLSSAACLILTPVPNMPTADVVSALVTNAHKRGVIVIADEVKTGFRRSFPTVTQEMRIEPDLVVLSKAVANGFPLAVLCGTEMLLGDSTLFRVFSTYASEVCALAAGKACLEALIDGAYEVFKKQSSRLFDQMLPVAQKYGARVVGVPTFFRLELPNHISPSLVCQAMYEAGFLYHPLDEILVSAAHTDAELDRAAEALDQVLEMQMR